ncbi:MAG: endonuclease/exonuclease/phosphatase family protein [Anaerolineales bacterium]
MFKRIHSILQTNVSVEINNPITPTIECQSITILSANLCHTWPKRNFPYERLHKFIELVKEKQADILLLQEVMHTDTSGVHGWLAEQLQMNVAYARTNGHRQWLRFEEGVAVLSRFPIVHTEHKFLKSFFHPFVHRQALAAQIATPWGKILAISTHLSITPWQNRHQIEQIQTWIEGQAHSAVLGGDFNAAEHTHRIARIQQIWIDTLRHIYPTFSQPFTHSLNLPFRQRIQQRLDYIFLIQHEPKWAILSAGIDQAYHFSDHLAVWAQLAPITSESS